MARARSLRRGSADPLFRIVDGVTCPSDDVSSLEAMRKTYSLVPTAGSPQLVEQPLRFFQIGGVEAFGEPTIDRRDQLAGFGAVTLVVAQPGTAHRGPQFPEVGPCSSAMLKALRYGSSAVSGCSCRSSSRPFSR
jgi:hypothetical protein